MARKKHYIETYNEKDRQAYLFLNNVCHCDEEQLKTFISKNRVSSYIKEGLLEKLDTSYGSFYRISKKGYKVFESQFKKENYKYHSISPKHDLALAQKYIDTYKHYGPNNFLWKNEEDLKQEREYQIRELLNNREWERSEALRTSSVVDCVITTPTYTIAYDVITDNYTANNIQSKVDYATSLELQLETHYI